MRNPRRQNVGKPYVVRSLTSKCTHFLIWKQYFLISMTSQCEYLYKKTTMFEILGVNTTIFQKKLYIIGPFWDPCCPHVTFFKSLTWKCHFVFRKTIFKNCLFLVFWFFGKPFSKMFFFWFFGFRWHRCCKRWILVCWFQTLGKFVRQLCNSIVYGYNTS